MHPKQALEVHKDVLGLMERPVTAAYLTQFMRDVQEKQAGPVIVDMNNVPSGGAMAHHEAQRLRSSETFYVSADMLALARFAAKGLDGLDQFTHDLWPVDTGFLVFEDALISPDVWGRDQAFKALSWGRRADSDGRAGTLIVQYADADDPRDGMSERQIETLGATEYRDVRLALGRYQVAHLAWLADGQKVGPAEIEADSDYAQYAIGTDVLVDKAPNTRRVIMALLMLMNQTVAAKTRHDLMPTKAVHAKRMPIPAQVTVVALRRQSGGEREHGETQVQWAHRWMVRGFWRSQSCGPNHPLAVEIEPGTYRARIWINPYVKGPVDAPFKQTEKVYALVR